MTVDLLMDAPLAGWPAGTGLDEGLARQLLSAARAGLMVLDQRGVCYANAAAAALFGRQPAALIGCPLDELVTPADRGRIQEQLRRRLAGEEGRPYDVRFLRADGRAFDGQIWGRHLRLDGRSVSLVAVTDVSELKDALRRAEWSATMLAESETLCHAGSYELSWPSLEILMSDGLQALTGVGAPAYGRHRLDRAAWLPAADRARVVACWRQATPGQPFEIQHGLLSADGRHLTVLQRGLLCLPTAEGAAPRGVAIVQDVTNRCEDERRIEELANFHEITGLANRANLLRQVETAAQQASQGEPAFSLLSIEVPRVTELAGTMGFGASDALAMALAARLAGSARPLELAAHLGGGEFALLVRSADGADRAPLRVHAQSVQAALQAVVRLGEADVFPQCRIGIAVFPCDAEDACALLEAAQTARLDAAAHQGIAFFERSANLRALRDLQLEAALRHAQARGELSLVYQPQVSLGTGAIVGVEALLRWQSPQFGAVSPADFIPLAERSGLIEAIGLWVIRQACEQQVRWREAGLPPVRIGINISPVQFQLGDVAASLLQAVRETGADPAQLGVEITEGALMHDCERVARTLRSLQAHGIEIALDDFGTGYSSLSLLRRLPVDVVKIDRSFVDDVTAAEQSASMTRSIIHLAHGLRIRVLAEGAETEGQMNMLGASGCDLVQGYFFSRPVDAAALAALLAADRRLPAHLTRQHARARTLLLVDDEVHIVSSLKRLFRRDGYRVLSAHSGEQALSVLAEHEVDVIISDQRMPGMTGIDFLRQAKVRCPDTIRIILSGFTDLQSIIDAVNEGSVFRFLTKPWDDEHLRRHVAEAFGQKEMADENRRLTLAVTSANIDLAALNRRLGQLVQPAAPAAP